ncbi:SMI1/KNR4 family protein [Zunongwangia sp. HRR-M8]|uniref:SMI1/KNR4 family protein n=1 Tax=Zunongwangia sp. HRR-M8 TaxID=3015170 RepID=UPI0022DD750E|nr:SMI1/KNR4 family protein [Zunongwangia sp. HRR-M8]WBL23858.1 SMI1/KNR4 family protein [Zunongwangia sp. HRR-M8]
MINKDLIDKLNFLFEQKDRFLDYDGLVVQFKKKEGALTKHLDMIKSKSNLSLPPEYLNFLKYTDGCSLYKYEDIGGFEFLGTRELNQQNELQKDTYEEDWDDNLTVFCNVIGDGDFISFRKNPNFIYDILDCYHDDSPHNWKIIDNSFESFMEKLIEAKGERYWLR